MAGYVQIRGEALIYDERVEALSNAAYRLYMMTFFSQRRSMLGLIRWTAADILPRAKGWSTEDAEKAQGELIEAGLVEYDATARLLYNPRVTEFAPIRGYKQVKGAAALLAELPDSPILIPVIRQIMPELEDAWRAKREGEKPYNELAAIIKELRARLARLEEARADTPSIGVSSPASESQPDQLAPDTPSGGHDGGMMGVSRGYQGGIGSGTTTNGVPERAGPICGQLLDGMDRGSIGVSRGHDGGIPRARARPEPEPDPLPEPEPDKTPLTPLAGEQARGQERQGQRRRERESDYAMLDPRNRGASG